VVISGGLRVRGEVMATRFRQTPINVGQMRAAATRLLEENPRLDFSIREEAMLRRRFNLGG